jgi:hypothetical protein
VEETTLVLAMLYLLLILDFKKLSSFFPIFFIWDPSTHPLAKFKAQQGRNRGGGGWRLKFKNYFEICSENFYSEQMYFRKLRNYRAHFRKLTHKAQRQSKLLQHFIESEKPEIFLCGR